MASTPNMSNRVISFVRTVFMYALESQVVESNPCTGIRRHAEKRRDRYITDAEFEKICEKASPNMRVTYEVCYLTGQRISDVISIHLSDICEEGRYCVQTAEDRRSPDRADEPGP